MKNFKKIVFTALMATAALPMLAGDGVKVDHLGVNNTLVRVTGDGRYLLIPIQESNDDEAIRVLVDGKLEKVFHARLAKTRVDYMVPLDLEQFKGHDVMLNIITRQGRANMREAKEDACWDAFTVSNEFDTTNREKFRPAFHHTPLWGWMNDPNGMFYKDGVWHLYYQHNPYGSKWQNMTWGHSTSKDLINWEHQPEAIEPNGLGAVFSGSSVLDPKNTAGYGSDAVIAIYTSADASQVQSMAVSKDGGQTFTNNPRNPIITLESEARDPNMFWYEPTQQWVLTLAHALDHEMLIFTSPDLEHWTLQSSFGKGLGSQDGVWECPDLFELPVQGTDKKKWVLLCNINPGGPYGGSATQYFIGEFDGKTFTPDKDASGKVPTKWMDYGKDHYATVSWSDAPNNRRSVIGWMSNWQYAAEVPTMQYRSANTLPRDLYLFVAPDGSIELASAPSPEVDALRGKVVTKGKFNTSAKAKNFNLPATNDGICEIVIDFEAKNAKEVNFTLSNPQGEKVVMIYDTKARTISFDRTQSGLVDFSREFPAVTKTSTFENDGKVQLRLFVDRSSIELFGNDGRFVMTNLVFPNAPYSRLSVSSIGGEARIGDLKVYSIAE